VIKVKKANKIISCFLIVMFFIVCIPIGNAADAISTTIITNSKGHSWSLSGSNIQLAINDLGSSGGTVYLPETTYLSNGKLDVTQIFIPYNNIRITGAGVDKTKINFVGYYSFGLVASSNPGGSESNWKKGISNLKLDNFSFYKKSLVLVIRDTCILSDLKGYDITSKWAAIRFVCPYGDMKSENLKIINCNILRSSSHGFQLNAVELQGCVFDTVLFKGCSSTKAGCWEWSSHGTWSVGFDLAEGYGSASVKGGLTVRNLVVENCEAYECWESGFHFENKPIKQNIVFQDCISNFNGQKYMRTSKSTWSMDDIYGAGWLGVTSAMTLTRCTAKGNGAWGWYAEGSSPISQNCIGDKYPTYSEGNGCGTIPKGVSGGLYYGCTIKIVSSVFTTILGSAENLPPALGTPTPANGSTNRPFNFTFSIPMSDPEGNPFTWTIHCSNGQTKTRTGQTGGTYSMTLVGLTAAKTYKVWVNATDPTGSNMYTRRSYTYTTQ
jgi:hypothetical protein